MALSVAKPSRAPLAPRPADLLDAAFRRPQLIIGLDMWAAGKVVPRTIDWWDYWRPIRLLGRPELIGATAALRSAWASYIASGFDVALLQPYGFRYFTALDAIISATCQQPDSGLLREALRAVVGFESAGVSERRHPGGSLAAVTTTTRNPLYLLTRLKWPDIPHSTRFLPLVAVNDREPNTFGHYRRYRLAENGVQSLLVYPLNKPGGDTRSLDTISVLANALGAATDPFVADRAGRLWTHIVEPLLRQSELGRSRTAIEFIDIGRGTGALAGTLCEHIVRWSRERDLAPRFHLTLLDLGRVAAAPMLNTGSLVKTIESVVQVGADYRSWLATLKPSTGQRGARFGLACKVFDMASQFVVRHFHPGELPTPPAGSDWFSAGARSPAAFLSPRGRRPERLLVSPSRFEVEQGHLFAQPALSNYFNALSAVSAGTSLMPPGRVSLPVRVFDQRTLVTFTGMSVLAEMLRRVDFLLIEDADLRPTDLLVHIEGFRLHDIIIYDMTAAMGLTGNYAYVLLKSGSVPPRLDGERLQ